MYSMYMYIYGVPGCWWSLPLHPHSLPPQNQYEYVSVNDCIGYMEFFIYFVILCAYLYMAAARIVLTLGNFILISVFFICWFSIFFSLVYYMFAPRVEAKFMPSKIHRSRKHCCNRIVSLLHVVWKVRTNEKVDENASEINEVYFFIFNLDLPHLSPATIFLSRDHFADGDVAVVGTQQSSHSTDGDNISELRDTALIDCTPRESSISISPPPDLFCNNDDADAIEADDEDSSNSTIKDNPAAVSAKKSSYPTVDGIVFELKDKDSIDRNEKLVSVHLPTVDIGIMLDMYKPNCKIAQTTNISSNTDERGSNLRHTNDEYYIRTKYSERIEAMYTKLAERYIGNQTCSSFVDSDVPKRKV